MLTKSDFLEYLRCPREYWLNKNTEAAPREMSLEHRHRREQGYEIEGLARTMSVFKRGIFTFQMVFETDEFQAKSDIVETDGATNNISIYEVKSGASVKDDYICDVGFQVMVAEKYGYTVDHAYVVTVDTSYTRNGDLDVDRLLRIHDVTDEVRAMQPDILANARAAIEYLKTEPVPSLTEFCGEKLDCGFIRHHFRDIPEYNITHIGGLHKDKRTKLLNDRILDIRDVPDDFPLTEKQRRQVELARSGVPFIDATAIREKIDGLRYPLHFLDYETFSDAVPRHEGVRPYQQMLFQYSLHTIVENGAELTHKFHVSRNDGPHPTRETLERLHADLHGNTGSVVVWYDPFETRRNLEGGQMFPEFAGFLAELNASIFDLRKVFSEGHYIHPAFRNSTSIKKVLPVLCPDLTYEGMEIGDGMTASVRWYHMANKRYDPTECDRIYEALCAYCHLDTLAMVRIYEFLKNTSHEW